MGRNPAKTGGVCAMTDVFDKARIALLYPDKSKREKIEYETNSNKSCSVCEKEAAYKLSKTPVWFCPEHYNQLLNRALWNFVERYVAVADAIMTLYLDYNGKNINLEVLFTEKMMRDIQYNFRDAGFRNCKIDREMFLTIVRSCDSIAYADWIDDKLIVFRLPVHDCLITKQEWEEIKKRVIQKGLLKKSKQKQ